MIFFSQPLIVSRLHERPWVSVTNDSAFIEWSNPGSPRCQVHCFSLCSLPIWLSTALQVAAATSPHCYNHNAFWTDRCFTEARLWTSLKDFTTESIDHCNDIHNLSAPPPPSSLWWCISLWPQLSASLSIWICRYSDIIILFDYFKKLTRGLCFWFEHHCQETSFQLVS